MNQINLLPWREQIRKTKKVYFGISLLGAILLAMFFVFVTHVYYNRMISDQQERNIFIQKEIDNEKTSLAALEKKMGNYRSIESQIQLRIALRKQSNDAIEFLNEIATIVPSTILIKKISKKGDNIILDGKAESSAQITLFMKNIDDSPIFQHPVLSEISEDEANKNTAGNFQLKMQQNSR